MYIKNNNLKLGFLNKFTLITLIIIIFIELIQYLNSKGVLIISTAILDKIDIFSLIISTFFIISLFLRLTIKKVYNYFTEPEEKIFFSKIYKFFAYSLGLFIVLYTLGISLNNLVLLIGFLATGLGFAVRDVLLSFFSWTVLLRKKPFKIGDYIKIGEDQGKVLHIGTFFVVLDPIPEFSEEYIQVPNKLFLEKSIINYGKSNFHEKIKFKLKDIPDDKQKLLTLLKKEISKRVLEKNTVVVNIDLENEILYLTVEYLINFNEKQLRKHEVVEITYKIFKKYIYLPKN